MSSHSKALLYLPKSIPLNPRHPVRTKHELGSSTSQSAAQILAENNETCLIHT